MDRPIVCAVMHAHQRGQPSIPSTSSVRSQHLRRTPFLFICHLRVAARFVRRWAVVPDFASHGDPCTSTEVRIER